MHTRIALLLAFLGSLLSGCLPLPDHRGEPLTLQSRPRVAPVTVSPRVVHVPGADVPSTPDRFDGSLTLRWALDEPIDTIVIAIPGLAGGAMNMAPLARRLVAEQPGLAVWAWDRRGNQLEDRRPVQAALAGNDLEPLIDGYLAGDGASPSFEAPTREAWSFVADWGLDVHLMDLDAIVREARGEADRVVLLGHSLGASLASLYLAWRGPHGVGQDIVDGLVLVDGALGRTGALGFTDGVRIAGIPIGLPTRDALERGDADPWFPAGTGESFARRQAAASLATLDPEGMAPTAATRYPMTHLAFAGLLSDEGYDATQAFGVSLGTVVDADLDGNLLTAILAGRWGLRSGSVVGVAPDAAYIDWTRGDRAYERTDPGEYFRAASHPEADVAEWYTPAAMLLDLFALSPDLRSVPPALEGRLAFVPGSSVTTPTLAIGSDRGILKDPGAFGAYAEQRRGSSFTIEIVEGLTHVDLLTAEENPAVPLVARWVSLLR